MQNENFSVYLNDHLAGSVSALELIDHLIESKVESALKGFLKGLRPEIQSDQETLKRLMEDLGIAESRFKTTTAWVAEKAGRIKLHSTHENDIGILHSLEGLTLGIAGKKALWRALPLVAGDFPQLKEIDFARLEMRAAGQFDSVESNRLEAARKILAYRG